MGFLDNKRILVVGAHSDDEVLGCGGVIAKAVAIGSSVDVLIVTDGVSSQYQQSNEIDKLDSRRRSHLEECCNILGVRNYTQWELPDMRLDTLPHVDINRLFESYFETNMYDVVFVHHGGDINKDHRVVFESVMVALRPVPSQRVKYIFTYNTPSSTEWGGYNKENYFVANIFVDISGFLEIKLKALNAYKEEMRDFPHPRSVENIKNCSKYFGATVGLDAVEPFQLIRGILE